MEIFKTTDEMVDAIMNCKDKEDAKAGLNVIIGFGMHESSAMTSGVEKTGLPKKDNINFIDESSRKHR